MHIIPLPASEIERKILNIPDHWGEVADQRFDPESIHAQSGTAVAEAIADGVKHTAQELTVEQQLQARENIGAASNESVAQLVDNKADKAELTAHNTAINAHEDIRADVSAISALVGDTAVSTQVSTAIDELTQDVPQIVKDNFPGGVGYTEITTLIPETTYTFEDWDGYMGVTVEEELPIVDGETYEVVWNGVSYDCKARVPGPNDDWDTGSADLGDGSVVALGNIAYANGTSNSGEPFLIRAAPAPVNSFTIVTATGTTSAVVAIHSKSANKIDPEYIPEDYISNIIEEQFLPGQMKYEGIKPTEFVQSNKSTRIVYGGDKFVAIPGTTGSGAAYSYDGIEWIDVSMPGQSYSHLVYGVNNGANMFFAYGSGGSAAYSYDGIVWKESMLNVDGKIATSFGYNAVAYGNGRFIAVGANNTAAYSESGLWWTTTSISFMRTNWTNIFYGGGKFIAVDTKGGNYALYTSDGITWNAATLPISIRSGSCAYGDGKFVMFNSSSNSGVCSEDGINWTAMQVAGAPGNTSFIGWSNVVYGNGKFIAVDTSANSNTAAYSYDGINWTLTTMSGMNSPDSIAYGNGLFVAVCTSTTSEASVVYSRDGIKWYSEEYSVKQGIEIVPVVFSVNGVKPDSSGDVLLDIEEFLPGNIARVEYVDEAIAAIPTPDVSGQIGVHNTSATAHEDIRAEVAAISTLVGSESVATQISEAIDEIKAITFEEIDEICNAEPFSYDDSGNVSVLSLSDVSDVSYDAEGNVVIS